MPYYPVTLDVERARWWLTKNHPTWECRGLAELLHDYSLTVLQPKPVDPRKEKITKEQFEKLSVGIKELSESDINDGALEDQECGSGSCPVK